MQKRLKRANVTWRQISASGDYEGKLLAGSIKREAGRWDISLLQSELGPAEKPHHRPTSSAKSLALVGDRGEALTARQRIIAMADAEPLILSLSFT